MSIQRARDLAAVKCIVQGYDLCQGPPLAVRFGRRVGEYRFPVAGGAAPNDAVSIGILVDPDGSPHYGSLIARSYI